MGLTAGGKRLRQHDVKTSMRLSGWGDLKLKSRFCKFKGYLIKCFLFNCASPPPQILPAEYGGGHYFPHAVLIQSHIICDAVIKSLHL